MPSRRELANAIRALSMDAVQQAKSGHPGAPMGMADIAEVLWNGVLKHNPAQPGWTDRDRFVLSNGHGSMLLYSLLHLSGYDLPIEQLKDFRQLHSKTAGHPELGITPGVETTTGPLGQGLANAVGMALAERTLAAQFNRPGHAIVDHHTYAMVGDGCLMEGISHEVCSLAGTLGLAKLIVLYDDNGISIDGPVGPWFADDTPKRFEAYGWQVIADVDGHDSESIEQALEAAKAEQTKPSLICCKTTIGFGAPNKAGTHGVHGAPLGDDEIAAARRQLGWPHPPFVVPEAISAAWNGRERGALAQGEWSERFQAYRSEFPQLAAELERRQAGDLCPQWQTLVASILDGTNDKAADLATRASSEQVLNLLGPELPELLGGSADLTGSNNTLWQGSAAVNESDDGNYIYYGVREFGMFAMMNGIALHGGFIPYGGTFLVFSDYGRNAIRMASLMGCRAIFVLTHDSIGLGEDGPTHQPIEHLASLRMIPNLSLWRPCDAVETAAAWRAALERSDGPTCLVLSRQKLPHQNRGSEQIQAIERGGYVLADCSGTPDVILISTGSEVDLTVRAASELTARGRSVRVVSMPSVDRFEAQDAAYHESVLPAAVRRRVAIEAGVAASWHRYVGAEGAVIGLDRFGESAPAEEVFVHLGITVDATVSRAESLF